MGVRGVKVLKAAAAGAATALVLTVAVVSAPAGSATGSTEQARATPPGAIVRNNGRTVAASAVAAANAGVGTFRAANPGSGAPGGSAPVTVETGTADPLGPAAPNTRSVLGADGRTQVTPTSGWPSRAIGQIVFGGFVCTGWLVDANTVITAGHCVSNGDGTFIDTGTMAFIPGRDGGTEPYGSCGVTSSYTTYAWLHTAAPTYDYGAIILDCTIGNTTGWMGYFKVPGVTALQGQTAHVRGYPADKSLGTQWTMRGTVAASRDRFVYYPIDTFGGQSGSPVYQFRGTCGACAMAIHAYGAGGSGPGATNNGGPRINAEVFANLNLMRSR